MFRSPKAMFAAALLCLLLLAAVVPGFVRSVRAAKLSAPPADVVAQLPRADDVGGAQTGVPDFEMETVKGTKLRLSSLRGRIALLDFFSATCPHCQKHAPFIAGLAKRYRDKGLVVVNMASNNQFVEGDKVEAYIREAGIDNEVVWSPLELFKLYIAPNAEGVVGVPYTVLFGADGRVLARFSSFEAIDQPKIEQAIAKAVARGK